jgi:hypothetical protein
MQWISWLTEDPLDSPEGLCSMELVVGYCVSWSGLVMAEVRWNCPSIMSNGSTLVFCTVESCGSATAMVIMAKYKSSERTDTQ